MQEKTMLPIILKIDSDFYKEEEKCGFFISRKRKELWAVEIDLLMQLDRICKKHGLAYCVGAGTLLGAIRHQGFIPWDDDIDVYMLRPDYDRLMDIAGEFEEPYFLQNSYTEKNLLRTYARLRNSQTTGTTTMDQYRILNHGIFIDIFPLDGISENRRIDRWQHFLNTVHRKLFEAYNASKASRQENSLSKKLKYPFKKILAELCIRDKSKLFASFERNLKRFSVEGTKMWGNRTLVFECPKSRRPFEDWTNLVTMPFEFVEVPVPASYDSMLRQQYGDYMKIPENKSGTMHGELIFESESTYTDHSKKAKNDPSGA